MTKSFPIEYELSLLRKAKAGDERSIELLLEQYTPMVAQFTKNTNIPGYDKEDLKQEFFLSMLQAIKTYDETKAKFITHLHYNLGFGSSNIIKQQKRDKRKIVYANVISFDDNSHEDLDILNMIEDPNTMQAFEGIVTKHSLPNFNETEFEIFNMEQQGIPNADIAREMDMTVTRISKIKQVLNAKIAHHRKLYNRT